MGRGCIENIPKSSLKGRPSQTLPDSSPYTKTATFLPGAEAQILQGTEAPNFHWFLWKLKPKYLWGLGQWLAAAVEGGHLPHCYMKADRLFIQSGGGEEGGTWSIALSIFLFKPWQRFHFLTMLPRILPLTAQAKAEGIEAAGRRPHRLGSRPSHATHHRAFAFSDGPMKQLFARVSSTLPPP